MYSSQAPQWWDNRSCRECCYSTGSRINNATYDEAHKLSLYSLPLARWRFDVPHKFFFRAPRAVRRWTQQFYTYIRTHTLNLRWASGTRWICVRLRRCSSFSWFCTFNILAYQTHDVSSRVLSTTLSYVSRIRMFTHLLFHSDWIFKPSNICAQVGSFHTYSSHLNYLRPLRLVEIGPPIWPIFRPTRIILRRRTYNDVFILHPFNSVSGIPRSMHSDLSNDAIPSSIINWCTVYLRAVANHYLPD